MDLGKDFICSSSYSFVRLQYWRATRGLPTLEQIVIDWITINILLLLYLAFKLLKFKINIKFNI